MSSIARTMVVGVDVMNQIMRGETTDAQIGAYLMALRMKGETRSEIVVGVDVMFAAPVGW